MRPRASRAAPTCCCSTPAWCARAPRTRSLGRLQLAASRCAQGAHARALVVMGCFVGDTAALAQRLSLRGRLPAALGSGWPAAVWLERARRRAPSGAWTRRRSLRAAQVAEMVPISYGCDHHCTYCIVTAAPRARSAAARGRDRGRRAAPGAARRARDHAAGPECRRLRPGPAGGAARPGRRFARRARHRGPVAHPLSHLAPARDDASASSTRWPSLPKVCPCWELAVQSGDDEVLRRMARGYTVERFRDLVGRIRQATPEGAHQHRYHRRLSRRDRRPSSSARWRWWKQLRFDVVHVAAYSPRPGTVVGHLGGRRARRGKGAPSRGASSSPRSASPARSTPLCWGRRSRSWWTASRRGAGAGAPAPTSWSFSRVGRRLAGPHGRGCASPGRGPGR